MNRARLWHHQHHGFDTLGNRYHHVQYIGWLGWKAVCNIAVWYVSSKHRYIFFQSMKNWTYPLTLSNYNLDVFQLIFNNDASAQTSCRCAFQPLIKHLLHPGWNAAQNNLTWVFPIICLSPRQGEVRNLCVGVAACEYYWTSSGSDYIPHLCTEAGGWHNAEGWRLQWLPSPKLCR